MGAMVGTKGERGEEDRRGEREKRREGRKGDTGGNGEGIDERQIYQLTFSKLSSQILKRNNGRKNALSGEKPPSD